MKLILVIFILTLSINADEKENRKVEEIVETLKTGSYKERSAAAKKIDSLSKSDKELLKKILEKSKDPELTGIYKKLFPKEQPEPKKEADVNMDEVMNKIIPRFKENAEFEKVCRSLEALHGKLKIKIEANPGRKMNFDFENMPTKEIIRYMCIASNLKFRMDKNKVVIFK